LWLIGGILALSIVLVWMPDMNARLAAVGVPAAGLAVVRYVTIGFMAVIYVAVPGVLVLFY
jgi:hypothetical protein